MRASNAADTEWLVNQIAHALRNPVFAAMVQAEALSLRYRDIPEAAKATSILRNQLKRLEESLDDMLLYGRPARCEIQPPERRNYLYLFLYQIEQVDVEPVTGVCRKEDPLSVRRPCREQIEPAVVRETGEIEPVVIDHCQFFARGCPV